MDLTQPIITERRLATFWGKVKTWIQNYIPPVSEKTQMFFTGQVDDTSTRTDIKATVPGVTELKDGLVILVKNGVVASNTNCTLNINGLGAKRLTYSTTTTAFLTTQWAAATTVLLYYDSDYNSGDGAWVFYYGYDSNTNTIGYQLRTNYTTMPMTSKMYRYRLMFTSPDHQHYIPANNSTSTNATASRTPVAEKFDPFARIMYYGTTAAVVADANPAASSIFDQSQLTLGYSFAQGAALTMTANEPVYLVCTPQSDGMAIIDSTTPWTQALPTTDDGKIYIFLGVADSATTMELFKDHPIYWYKDGRVRIYNGLPYIPDPPAVNGTYTLQAVVNNGAITYSWV